METKDMLANIVADDYANSRDLLDLVTLMAATGVRISEACGLRPQQLDLDNALIEINAAVTDFGPEEKTKSQAGWRVIPIPPSTVELLRCRLDDPEVATDEILFPSPLGHIRDTSNTAADLRRVFNEPASTGSAPTPSVRPSPHDSTTPATPPDRLPTTSATPSPP